MLTGVVFWGWWGYYWGFELITQHVGWNAESLAWIWLGKWSVSVQIKLCWVYRHLPNVPVSIDYRWSRFHLVEMTLSLWEPWFVAIPNSVSDGFCDFGHTVTSLYLVSLLTKNHKQCLITAQVYCLSFCLLFTFQWIIAFQRQITSLMNILLSNKTLNGLKILQSLLWKKILWCSTRLDEQVIYRRATCRCTERVYTVENQCNKLCRTGTMFSSERACFLHSVFLLLEQVKRLGRNFFLFETMWWCSKEYINLQTGY